MQRTKTNQLYVLEKIWKFKPDLKISQDNMYEVLIRPCNVSYRTYRAFILGYNVKCQSISHEGCVLSWRPLNDISYCKQPNFKTFEEFMIYANVNKCVFPAIENWLIRSENYSTYYVKTIDLKTNEVLYDKIDDVLKKLSEQCNKSFA
jgi:hypothetical protein